MNMYQRLGFQKEFLLQEFIFGKACQEVLKNIEERDYIDANRDASPLARAADAILLDNSNMTLDEELVWLDGILKERFAFGLFD